MKTAGINMGTDFATPERLERLLGRAEDQYQATRHAARSLDVEVDGDIIGDLTPSDQPVSIALPSWSRSVTLRDEQGAARVHAFVQDQQLDRVPFDQGRLLVSISRVTDGRVQLTLEQPTTHVP